MVTLKQKLGCWLYERWRTEFVLLLPRVAGRFGLQWIDLCNRHERLARGTTQARICLWEDSSFLTVARFFPQVGARLLKHCDQEWPFKLKMVAPIKAPVSPKISIILPVGGEDRVSAFKCVVKAFFGQTYKNFEIIVVEHSQDPIYEQECSNGVKYIFLERNKDMGFNKSMAMNEGVTNASAPYVLLHDADVVPPRTFLESTVKFLEAGWDAVRPMRFIFHLNREDSEAFIQSNGERLPKEVSLVQQNNPGISTAVAKDVYEKIGGHDERFWGWGGEDQEFLDRLGTKHLYPGSYAPSVHIWHAQASNKASGDRNNELLIKLLSIPPSERIQTLRQSLLAKYGTLSDPIHLSPGSNQQLA